MVDGRGNDLRLKKFKGDKMDVREDVGRIVALIREVDKVYNPKEHLAS